ncbi:ATP-binding protein, partial [Pontibacterium sp.]
RNTGGIGLGLSITRTVAHAHGGDVLLRNLEPQGLEVTVSLPR